MPISRNLDHQTKRKNESQVYRLSLENYHQIQKILPQYHQKFESLIISQEKLDVDLI
jgi:hypothetical protein